MAHVVETSVIHRYRTRNVHAIINQYEIISEVGQGMHGKVMLARNTATDEKVAVKSLRRIDPHNRRLPRSNRPGSAVSAQQETESKIRREIAVMKKCSHQNLVRLLEVIDDSHSKKVYLVMENLAGGEVLWRSKDDPAPVLAIDQVQRIMRDVTLGLEYLHHQGIIHRDIKPANLLWTEDRQSVKICDFGVSHFYLATAKDGITYDDAGLSRTAGSPAFFAPEVCNWFDDPESAPPRQLPAITKQIDIWALGVTFYCLLFGTPPFMGENEFKMFQTICTTDFIIPDKMCAEGIPTGGRDFRPEGRDLGWCIVGLLNGLLEKDQTKRITLAEIKRIPWIHTGVRDPERWLRETAPEAQTRVTVTEDDAKQAIRAVWYSNIKSKIRSSLPKFSRSPPVSRQNAVAGPSTTSTSTNGASSSRKRSTGQFGRFMFGTATDDRSSSPSRAHTIPKEHHRRSAGKRSQTRSDPASRETSVSTPTPDSSRRPSDSLLHPPPSRMRSAPFGATSPCVSSTTSNSHGGGGFRSKVSALLRPQSAKAKSKALAGGVDHRGRTSSETLDGRTSSESAPLSGEQRAASWAGGGYADDQSSEVDPTRSVVEFGAGGYVDSPPSAGVYQRQWGAGSDSSSTSTATPQPHAPPPLRVHPPEHPPRVTSPLARDGDDDLANEVFDEPPAESSSDSDEALELRTRRPSTVLSRSADTSPLR